MMTEKFRSPIEPQTSFEAASCPKKRRSRWSAVAGLALFLSAGLGAGCGSETDPAGPGTAQDTAPNLPPVASMTIDLSRFDSEIDPEQRLAQMSAGADELGSSTQWNWWNAALRVAFMNLAVAQALTPPAAALHAAFSVEPVQIEPGIYEWIYEWTDRGGHQVRIALRAEAFGTHTVWELRVSDNQSSPVLEDALWFAGETRNLGREGYWSFFDPSRGDGVEVAHMDWHAERDDSELRLQATDPQSEDEGDSLVYTTKGSNVTVVYTDQSEQQIGTIAWDEETGAGYIEYPDYNDGERSCWDEEQFDVDCEVAA